MTPAKLKLVGSGTAGLIRVWERLRPSEPPSSARRPSAVSPTTRSVKPLPRKSPAKPVVGSWPPAGMDYSAPVGPMSVTSLEPELIVAIDVPEPLKLPRNRPLGAWPTG